MKKFLCVLLALCLFFMSSCAVSSPENNSGKKIIATSFYPIYIFTLNLANGIEELKVECMAEQNVGCLHDYTLTAKDVKLLSDADVLVINGAGMEGFIEDAIEAAENIEIIDSSENAELMCNDEKHHDEDSHHSHNHEENSHIWLSVDNAKKQVETIKNGLVERFPEYKERIESNYENYNERLNALIKKRDGFAEEIQGESVISFHTAYEYLAKETGFVIAATIESDEGGEPSAKKLAHLSKEIKESDVKALFVEPQYNGSAGEILQRETGVSVYILNPVTSGEAKLTAYEEIMSENYEIIMKAVK